MVPVRPATVEQLRELVLRTRRLGGRLRVHGSGHSVPAAIYAGSHRTPRGQGGDAPSAAAGTDEDALDVSLDRLDDVVISADEGGKTARVSVGAGARLGLDPLDPSHRSRWDTSLSYRLERAGFALDSLGGISHQSVAGFLLTGSSGGSLRYSAANNVVGLELVDGLGRVHEVRRDDADPKRRELFFAAGVSMGLLGVVTRVFLRVGARYDVVGEERSTRRVECAVDLINSDPAPERSIAQHLAKHDYGRILWWAQPGFDRAQVWAADRAPASAASTREPFAILSPGESVSGALLQTLIGHLGQLETAAATLPRWTRYLEQVLAGTYRPVDRPTSAGRPARRPGAALLARTIRQALGALLRLRSSGRVGSAAERWMPRAIAPLMRLYVPDGVKRFSDSWLYGLPMDNGLDDELWPAEFAEMWVPLEQANAALERLRALLGAGSPAQRYHLARTFPVELYAGPESQFWLSPGYQRRSLRINPVWLAHWPGPATDYFAPFFEALSDLDLRFHWGKHLPPPSATTRAQLRRALPRLQDFLRLRDQLDPDRVFLTPYWREHLGITRR